MSLDPFELRLHQLIEQSGSLQTGHFVLASGRHASRFFRCIRLFQDPAQATLIFDELATRFQDDAIHSVLGANEAGSILAFELALRLQAKLVVAREKHGSYQLMEGFTLPAQHRVLVVDDVTTTGGTVQQLLTLVYQAGSVAAGVGLIATKGLVELNFECRVEVLGRLTGMDAMDPAACLLCQQGIPLS